MPPAHITKYSSTTRFLRFGSICLELLEGGAAVLVAWPEDLAISAFAFALCSALQIDISKIVMIV
ncbi:MAG: hypothetical protein Q9224_002770 [Gallowayella concinna]